MSRDKSLTPEETARIQRLVDRAGDVADKLVECAGELVALEATLANMWADLDAEAAEIIAEHPDLAELNVMLDEY